MVKNQLLFIAKSFASLFYFSAVLCFLQRSLRNILLFFLMLFFNIQSYAEPLSPYKNKEGVIIDNKFQNSIAIYQRFTASFTDLIDAVEKALTEEGIVLSATLFPHKMLERTKSVVKGYQSVYDNAKMYVFCKSGLSHELVSYSPHNIALCPITITVYQEKDSPFSYLSYRKPPKDNQDYQNHLTLLQKVVQVIIEDLE